jgi:sugar phosphate isomerase/epimerase
MWSQGRFQQDGRDGDDMSAFARKTASLGFPDIEINYVIPPEGVEALLGSADVGVSSVHSPCPRVPWHDGRKSDALNLASPDDDERTFAVGCARAAVDIAVRAGAPVIVVHLGGIGSKIFPEEMELRKLFDSGTRDGTGVKDLRRAAEERRRDGYPAFFPHAQRSLAEIVDYAAPRGVAVGLENRYHFHEFPGPDEQHTLLADYQPDTVGFWLDVGHAEVLDRLGFHRYTRWLDELADRCIGVHVHDVDGLADHRAPGHGTADWAHYSALLPSGIPRVFEINQKIDEDKVAASIPFLRGQGVLPAATDMSVQSR